jgi:hypothetical protein
MIRTLTGFGVAPGGTRLFVADAGADELLGHAFPRLPARAA